MNGYMTPVPYRAPKKSKLYRAKFSSPRRLGAQDSGISIHSFHTIDSAYFL